MDNIIIFIMLALVLGIAAGTIFRRRRNQASCCGSGAYVAKSRRLDAVSEKLELKVEGMHCQHCVNRVMEAVQDIPGCSAAVNLKKGLVSISMEQHVDSGTFISRIEKAGYTVKN